MKETEIRVQGQDKVVKVDVDSKDRIQMYYQYTQDNFRKGKDYDLVVYAFHGVKNWRRTGEMVEIDIQGAVWEYSQIDCDGELRPIMDMNPKEGFDALLQIQVFGAGTFRVMGKRGSAPFVHETVMLEGMSLIPGTFDIIEEDTRIILKAEKADLLIDKMPFAMHIQDKMGRRIYSQNNEDKVVNFAFESLPFGFAYNPHTEESIAAFSSRMDHDEQYFGFGEQYSPANKKMQEVDVFITDPLSVGTSRTYLSLPFYMSSKGYGCYVNTHFRSKFFMGNRSNHACSAHIDSEDILDIFLFYGPTYREILKSYTDITGKSPMVPKWSFGLWMSRCSYKTQEEVMAVARDMRAHDIPCDVLNIDTDWFEKPWACDWKFGKETFPDPKAMMDALLKMGIKISVWQKPYITVEHMPEMTAWMQEKGWLPINSHGELARANPVFDISNPEAYTWYKEQLKQLFELGVRVIKTDMGEGVPLEANYYGYGGKEMRNIYAYLYNKAAYEATMESQGEGLLWARSGYAGSQKFPIHWAGDPTTDFDGLRHSIRSGLSMGLSGFTFWSHDIGGFLGRPTPEVYIRWAQAGMFCSHSRAHGAGNPREPWTFGEEAENIFRKFTKLRYRLLPYIYSMACAYSGEGLPIMRHLALDFQEDPWTVYVEDQWMFGEAFLVAPILDSSCTRKIYLPKGKWIDFWSLKEIEGGCFIDYEAPLDFMPLFVREGSIIPFGSDRDFIEGTTDQEITLKIYDKGCGSSDFCYNNGQAHLFTAEFLKGEVIITVPEIGCPVHVEFIYNGKVLRKENVSGVFSVSRS